MPWHTAPHSAGWDWRAPRNVRGPYGAAPPGVLPFPELLVGVRMAVEIAWGADPNADPTTWVWTDVTLDIRQDPGIRTRLGSSDEAGTSQPAQCEMVLDNSTSKYSLGGHSPNWPNVRRNVPVRVKVDPDNNGFDNVFQGYADGFTPGWDSDTGDLPVVTMSASGVLRRLAQGTAQTVSAHYLTCAAVSDRWSFTTDSCVAYWPFEEGKDATFAANHHGGSDMTLSGTVTWDNFSEYKGSKGLPTLGTGIFTGTVDTYTPLNANGGWSVSFPLAIPDAGFVADRTIISIESTNFRVEFKYESSNDFGLYVYNSSDVLTDSNTALGISGGANGTESYVVLSASVIGGSVFITSIHFPLDGDPANLDTGVSTVTPTVAIGTVNEIIVNPSGNATGVSIGHIAVSNSDDTTPFWAFDLSCSYDDDSENVTSRLTRLCFENNVGYEDFGFNPVVDNLNMGFQEPGTFVELLRRCEQAGMGRLWDGVSDGVEYTCREFLEDASSRTLTLPATYLFGAFDAVDDDQRIRNSVTASRDRGVSTTYTDYDSTQGVASVGLYAEEVSINLARDADMADFAAWQVNLGTFEGYRYPTVRVDLTQHSDLVTDALDLIVGSRVTLTGLSDVLSSMPLDDEIDLVVEGISHDISSAGWVLTLVCSPWTPWAVARYAATSGDTDDRVWRVDTDGSEVGNAYAVGAVSVVVQTASGPLWTTTADNYPLLLLMGGVPVTATACSGATSPQTFTVDPLVAPISVGDPVVLYEPRPLGY